MLPVGFPDQAAHHLAIGVFRQFGDKIHASRLLETGQCTAAALDELGGVKLCAGLEHHHSAHRFTPLLVRHADHCHLEHFWEAVDHLLHFAGVHVEAPGNDHFLLAVDDEHVTLRIDRGQVAGQVVAVAHDFGGERRRAPVALHDVRPLDHDFADLARCHILECLVHHPQVGFEIAAPARGQALVVAVFDQVVLLGQHRDQRAGFAGTITLHENRPEQFDGLFHQGRGHGRGAIHDQFEAGQVEALDVGIIDQPVDHGRYQEQPRHPLTFDGLQQQAIVVAVEQQVAGAHRQQRHDLHAAGMGDRPHMGHHIIRAGAPRGAGDALADQRLAVAKRQHGRLEHTGAAGGVMQHCQGVVGRVQATRCLAAALKQRGITQVTALALQRDHLAQHRQGLASFSQRLGEGGIGDQRNAAGVFQHPYHFIQRQPRVDRHLDHRRLVQRHLCLYQLHAVGSQDRHMFTAGNAQCTQPRGKAVAAPFQLGIGQARLAVRHGSVVRPVAGTAGNDRSKVHVVVLVDRKTSTMLNSQARADVIPVSDAGHNEFGWHRTNA
ncbi:hypothetical protein D3C79_597900 [compost metagenome]